MKIRLGFVSNSSSSSYCIHRNGWHAKYSDIFELAQDMVLHRGWTREQLEEWGSTNEFDDERLFNVLEEDKKIVTTDGIAFPSCNFDTYIRQFGDKFVIQTCNNHPWYDLDWQDVLWEKWPPELLEEARELYKTMYAPEWANISLGELSEFAEFHLSKTGRYWYPTYRMFGKEPIRQREYACKKGVLDEKGHIRGRHNVDEVQLESGEIICPLCKLGK